MVALDILMPKPIPSIYKKMLIKLFNMPKKVLMKKKMQWQ